MSFRRTPSQTRSLPKNLSSCFSNIKTITFRLSQFISLPLRRPRKKIHHQSSQGDHQVKTKIIPFSDFAKASEEGCCSATRFFDHCEDCTHIKYCKHPEAWAGKLKILDSKIAEAKKQIKKWEEEKNVHTSRLQ